MELRVNQFLVYSYFCQLITDVNDALHFHVYQNLIMMIWCAKAYGQSVEFELTTQYKSQ